MAYGGPSPSLRKAPTRKSAPLQPVGSTRRRVAIPWQSPPSKINGDGLTPIHAGGGGRSIYLRLLCRIPLWDPIICKLPLFSKSYANYLRNKRKIIQTTPAKHEIIQTTPTQNGIIQATPAQNTNYPRTKRLFQSSAQVYGRVQLDT